MFKFFARIFGYVLNFIYGLVNNYGLAIIIFTILLRIILLPINLKQQKTMKKTAKIQEKMKEIQDKYSNDPIRLNEEVRNLYAEEHMSPFSGCLSSILQIVIIISIFVLVSNPLTYMKQLSSKKISEYTKIVEEEYKEKKEKVNYIEIAIIRSLGKTHKDVYLNMDFLGLDLSDIPSKNFDNPKVYIIPFLYVTTSFISMRMATSMNNKKKKEEESKVIIADKEEQKLVKVDKNKEEEDAMESMNKSMRYMMPLMTVSIACIAPLGLALYWFISNLLMIFERLFVNKFVKEED